MINATSARKKDWLKQLGKIGSEGRALGFGFLTNSTNYGVNCIRRRIERKYVCLDGDLVSLFPTAKILMPSLASMFPLFRSAVVLTRDTEHSR